MLRRLPWKPRQAGVLLREGKCPVFPARLRRGLGPLNRRCRDRVKGSAVDFLKFSISPGQASHPPLLESCLARSNLTFVMLSFLDLPSEGKFQMVRLPVGFF